MKYEKALAWLKNGPQRQMIFLQIRQPVTAEQLSRNIQISLDAVSAALREMSGKGLLTCLNAHARTSRLYWLSLLGIRHHKRLLKERDEAPCSYELCTIDWQLYGWTCYRHRSAVLKAISGALQPAEIKRLLYRRRSSIRISANNVRDIIRLFEKHGIVHRVHIRKKKQPRYELTEAGEKLKRLHLKADSL